ncbi:MAG: cohesin domain-containing protein [Euryarchaeota archaeon]|nr:cohesin domain-containing protein [Euryarchaeota archaeon]
MKKMLLLFTFITVLVMLATGAAAEEPEANVSVRVNAPESVAGTFEVTIDVEDIAHLDSGEFNISFNPGVVSFVDVEPGSIDGNEVPIDMFDLVGDGSVRMLFNIKGADGVSGSGYMAKIIFETEGAHGDTSIMDISDGLLVGVNPNMDKGDYSTWTVDILADWFNDTVTIGDATQAAPIARSTPRPMSDAALDRSLDPTQESTIASVVQEVSSVVDSARESEKDEPDGPELLTTQNCIYLYTLVGLFAFIYAFTLLR